MNIIKENKTLNDAFKFLNNVSGGVLLLFVVNDDNVLRVLN